MWTGRAAYANTLGLGVSQLPMYYCGRTECLEPGVGTGERSPLGSEREALWGSGQEFILHLEGQQQLPTEGVRQQT